MNMWFEKHFGWTDYASYIGLKAIIGLVGFTTLMSIDTYGIWYSYVSAPQVDMWVMPWGEAPRAAVQHALLAICFSIMAMIGFSVYAIWKTDTDPENDKMAEWAYIVGVLCLFIPMLNQASAFALDRQTIEFLARQADTDLWASLKSNLDAQVVGTVEYDEALKLVTKPVTGNPHGGDWLLVLALNGLVLACARFYVLPAYKTKDEKKAIRQQQVIQTILSTNKPVTIEAPKPVATVVVEEKKPMPKGKKAWETRRKNEKLRRELQEAGVDNTVSFDLVKRLKTA